MKCVVPIFARGLSNYPFSETCYRVSVLRPKSTSSQNLPHELPHALGTAVLQFHATRANLNEDQGSCGAGVRCCGDTISFTTHRTIIIPSARPRNRRNAPPSPFKAIHGPFPFIAPLSRQTAGELTPSQHLGLARLASSSFNRVARLPLPEIEKNRVWGNSGGGRREAGKAHLAVAYWSFDYREHAMGHLTRGVFCSHKVREWNRNWGRQSRRPRGYSRR